MAMLDALLHFPLKLVSHTLQIPRYFYYAAMLELMSDAWIEDVWGLVRSKLKSLLVSIFCFVQFIKNFGLELV